MTPMIVEHPLLQHKISILRNKQTGTKEFRDLVGEIAIPCGCRRSGNPSLPKPEKRQWQPIRR